MPLENPLAYNMYFNLRIANHILIKIYLIIKKYLLHVYNMCIADVSAAHVLHLYFYTCVMQLHICYTYMAPVIISDVINSLYNDAMMPGQMHK